MSRLVRTLCAASVVTVLGAASALAEADGPDAWRVTGVASDDVLNARVGPGVDYFVIASLPHNARGVQMDVCVPTITRDQFFALSGPQQAALDGYTPWCLVSFEGQQLGWVNRRFLAEDGQ